MSRFRQPELSEARPSATSSGLAVARLTASERLLALSSVAAVAALAWLALLAGGGHLHPARVAVAAPHPAPAGVVGYFLAVGMWLVMMLAMMLPPVMPWLLLVASIDEGAGGRWRRTSRLALFAAGYFSTWLGYSMAAAALQLALQRQGLIGLDLRLGAVVSGALVLTAGLYQLSDLKQSCLRHCRNPLTFLLTRWRPGAGWVFGLGLRHGLYCLGCCWALMALSFALGLMNLLWMAALTVILCLEKLARGGRLWSRVFGWGLAAWGLWALLAVVG